MDIVSIFITGLFAGGLTCLAVQGGLLASSLAQQEQNIQKEKLKRFGQTIPVISFLAARLIAYTFLGFLLGSLGSVVELSLGIRVFLQFAVAVFMIGTALNLVNAHPIFRYFVIQPPKFLTRLVKTQSKSKSIFGPALLGAFTILIPCGATQAMMAYAISTGSPLLGAITMFTFILGTSPLFFILGYVMKHIGAKYQAVFNVMASTAIILIALFNINSAFALAGSTYTLESLISSKTSSPLTVAISEATIYFTPIGYTTEPKEITVKAGSKVKLNLINKDVGGCIQAFTIPLLGIQKIVTPQTNTSIVFTAPTEKGPMPFMCSMGMFRGVITII